MASNEVSLWCPHCGRHRSFRPCGPQGGGPLAGRRRAACQACGGVWQFGAGRGRRTVCEAWEEPPGVLTPQPPDPDPERVLEPLEP